MRKIISLTLALIMALGLISLVACGGDENEPDDGDVTTPAATEATSETSSESGGLTWSDIPVYPNADQLQQASMSMTIPADEEGWSDVAWRYFETGDSVDDVVAFYKSEMPDNGWQEMTWMQAPGYAVGYYVKNNEQDGAMFWCGEEDGKTVFALMRSAQ